MSLAIIGAGFGRTGTLSLKLALEKLGFSPCYHMLEVFDRPQHIPLWHAAARGEPVDWAALFEGFRAAVDWPACAFWRELRAEYPDAHVLLSYRDPDDWHRSVCDTIYPPMVKPVPDDAPPLVAEHRQMVRRLILDGTFGGRLLDRDHAIRVYEEHNAAVRREVPADRLILHEVGSGWKPICDALDLPVPDEAYPRTNSTADFQERMRLRGL